ncbi:ImmA/IrrE family metallo-endopeptidase [Haloarcula marina]|uniref:ImmA/IrrE family metallo-endopeptidase n=1 Tax=Haloarcula marina TaxID=2961574 RepID=UPI0020B837DC|nr:ImmA/IrrE family metallo-endopeptidase [Halomicroarcula marina]
MTNYRSEILEAAKEAGRFKDRHLEGGEFDLWGIVDKLDIPIFFRPLDNLWGGAITVRDQQGILIKADLPKHLQRFTLAHELGHVVLGHGDQVDDECSVNMRVSTDSERPIEEITADAFASELLASRDIVIQHARRNGWGQEELQTPKYIYQLSNRLGLSFEATLWTLVGHDLLSQEKGEEFNDNPDLPKECKNFFVPDSIPWNSYADIWSLSEKESSIRLNADEEDIFVIELEELASSGYRWEFPETSPAEKIYDGQSAGEKYGSSGSRKFAFMFPDPGNYNIQFRHMRPWNNEVIEELKFSIDTRGGQEIGLPRNRKEAFLQGGMA